MRNILLTISLFLLCFNLQSQILNIEDDRIRTDTTGWSGRAGLDFTYLKTSAEAINSAFDAKIQYKRKKSSYLALTRYSLAKTGNSEVANALTHHFRFKVKLNKWISAEIYTQGQFNKVLMIQERYLLGSGPRFRVIRTDSFRLYTGHSLMYEYEKSSAVPHSIARNLRISNYVSFTWQASKNFTLIHTSYFQPLANMISDFRYFAQTDLFFAITKKLRFKSSYYFTYDSKPVQGVVKNTHLFTSGISFSF